MNKSSRWNNKYLKLNVTQSLASLRAPSVTSVERRRANSRLRPPPSVVTTTNSSSSSSQPDQTWWLLWTPLALSRSPSVHLRKYSYLILNKSWWPVFRKRNHFSMSLPHHLYEDAEGPTGQGGRPPTDCSSASQSAAGPKFVDGTLVVEREGETMVEGSRTDGWRKEGERGRQRNHYKPGEEVGRPDRAEEWILVEGGGARGPPSSPPPPNWTLYRFYSSRGGEGEKARDFQCWILRRLRPLHELLSFL